MLKIYTIKTDMRSSKHTNYERLAASSGSNGTTPTPTNWITVLKFAWLPLLLLLVLLGSGVFLLLESTGPTCVPSNLIGGVFCTHYTSHILGGIPGLSAFYGGLTFLLDDPNTMLVAGHADTPQGAIYQVMICF